MRSKQQIIELLLNPGVIAVVRAKRADQAVPLAEALDGSGGHTGVTVDSPTAPVYHYHTNEQTSTTAGTAGQKSWFLTKDRYHSTPAPCSTCM